MADISFRLLRSSTEAKRPTAAQIADGELALNTDNGTGGIFFEDTSGNVVKVGPAELGGSAPNSTPAGSAGNSAGEFWVDTSNGNHILKVYNGTSWVTVEGVAASAASATEVLFSGTNGALTGDANFTYNATLDTLTVGEVIGALDGPIRFTAQAGEDIIVGDVVYISGAAGDTPIVSLALASDAAKMPAFGFAYSAATSGNALQIVTFGSIEGSGSDPIDTSGLTVNDVIYVSPTTAGAWTTTKPTGEANLLQNIGRVQRVNSNNGVIKVGGAGRTNATPNLDEGNVFIGDSNDTAVSQSLSSAVATATGISSTATSTVITLTDLTATFDTDIVQTPSVSLSPANNGELIVEATSDTSLTFKLKGSDGVVRSAVLTLS